jgi:disulfide bond formation protein DsbB
VTQLSAAIDRNDAARDRLFLMAILAASIGAVTAALIGDFEFDLADVTPCLYQRVPYLLAAALAGAAIVTRPNPARYRLILVVCALLFACSSSSAAFREGVQQGWWTASGICADPVAPALASLRTTLSGGTIESACDDVETTFLSMSLTMLNFAYSSALTLLCIIAAAITDRRSGIR